MKVYPTRLPVDGYRLPVKYCTRALTYFHDMNDNCLIILSNGNDAFKAAEYSITDNIVGLKDHECIMFLCDGGIEKALKSRNVYGQPFVQWRYTLSLSGKVLNKGLGSLRRMAGGLDIKAPLVLSDIVHMAREMKRNTVALNDSKIKIEVWGLQKEFKIKRAVLYSRYLFLRSFRYKLYLLNELRKRKIPVSCICTDGDETAINMIGHSLATENIFGFTNLTLNMIAKNGGNKVLLDDRRYQPYDFKDGISVKSLYADAERQFESAKRVLALAAKDKNQRALASDVKSHLLKIIETLAWLRASCVPPQRVNFYSHLLSVLNIIKTRLYEFQEEAVKLNAPHVYQAVDSIITGIGIIFAQTDSEEKLRRLRIYVEENPNVMLITWSKSEGDIASVLLNTNVIYPPQLTEVDHVLFGGILSTWKFLDVVRQTRPLNIGVIGWDVEIGSYNMFRQKYLGASEMLYEYDLELSREVSKVLGNNGYRSLIDFENVEAEREIRSSQTYEQQELVAPQADDLDKVIAVAELIANNISSSSEIANRLKIVSRQGSYYVNACELLGLVMRSEQGLIITALGDHLVKSSSGDRYTILRNAILDCPLFNTFINYSKKTKTRWSLEEVANFIGSNTGLSHSTALRRALTFVSWLSYIGTVDRIDDSILLKV